MNWDELSKQTQNQVTSTTGPTNPPSDTAQEVASRVAEAIRDGKTSVTFEGGNWHISDSDRCGLSAILKKLDWHLTAPYSENGGQSGYHARENAS